MEDLFSYTYSEKKEENKIITVNGLQAGYQNKKIIEDLSLNIKKGEIVSIIGPNGSGKSTLLSCLTRAIKPYFGEILLEGDSIFKSNIKDFAKKVAILTQHHSISGNVTVGQLVTYGRLPHKKWYQRQTEEDYKVVRNSMEYTDVLKYEDRFLSSLSGGEQQRVWIAMALAQTPDLLFLDEPTTYLDISYQLELMKLIRNINKVKKITVVMVLHDLNQAAEYSDKIVIMKKGKIFDYGIPENVMTFKNLKDVYNIKCHICKNEINKKLIIAPMDICN